jgi:hypothetical protein
MESEQIYSTLQAELASVQSKVNSWSLNKEKELQQLKSSHTAFLDSHNGAASSPLPRRPLQQRSPRLKSPTVAGKCKADESFPLAELTQQLKSREKQVKARSEKDSQGAPFHLATTPRTAALLSPQGPLLQSPFVLPRPRCGHVAANF